MNSKSNPITLTSNASSIDYTSIPYERRQELRKLDAQLATEFRFFTSVEMGPTLRRISPKGIPAGQYDEYHRGDYGRALLETIPYYSTDVNDFARVQERVKSWYGAEYIAVLAEAGFEEETATLEQKCQAALHASLRARKIA